MNSKKNFKRKNVELLVQRVCSYYMGLLEAVSAYPVLS